MSPLGFRILQLTGDGVILLQHQVVQRVVVEVNKQKREVAPILHPPNVVNSVKVQQLNYNNVIHKVVQVTKQSNYSCSLKQRDLT